MTAIDVGERIKNRRKSIGMSAEKLAELVGVSAATVYRWENGDIGTLKLSIVKPLSEALMVSEAFLAGWEDTSSSDFSEYELSLLQAFRIAPAEVQRIVDAALAPYKSKKTQRAI